LDGLYLCNTELLKNYFCLTNEDYNDLFSDFFGKEKREEGEKNIPPQNGKMPVNGQNAHPHQENGHLQHITKQNPPVNNTPNVTNRSNNPQNANVVRETTPFPPPPPVQQPQPQQRPVQQEQVYRQPVNTSRPNTPTPQPTQRVTAPPLQQQQTPQPNPTIVRSEEVHEILTRIPSWIVRWGISLVFIILMGILSMSYFIKYPDVVEGRINLTAGNPPAPVVTKASGAIQILTKDGSFINERQVFAYVKNATNFDDVITLNRRLKELKQELKTGESIKVSNWPDLELGQIQSAYNNLVFRIKENANIITTLSDNVSRKSNIDQQIREINNLKNKQLQSIERLKRDYETVLKTFKTRHKPLFRSGVISANELEIKEREVMQKLNTYQNAKSSLNEFQNRILSLQSQKNELDFSKRQETVSTQNAVADAYGTLLNTIKLWEEQYLLRAPIEGKINYLQFVKNNSFVHQDQELANIIPKGNDDEGQILGELFVPARGTGKIAVGQQVNIELDDFIKKEYGMVKGVVESISDVGTEIAEGQFAYKIHVELPQGLRTKGEKPISFRHNMAGKAEVITEDVRLIARIFNEIKGIFDDF